MKPSDAQLEQLTAYLDGELTEHERREVDVLLARDPRAAALLESLRQVSESVASLRHEAAPTGMSSAIQDRMARQSLLGGSAESPTGLPPIVMWTNRLAIAACLGLVCTAGWLGMQNRAVRGPAMVRNEVAIAPPTLTDSLAKESRTESLAFDNSTGRPTATSMGHPADAPATTPAPPTTGMLASAFRSPGDFEKRLIQTGVTNRELQQADPSTFSNQIVIETEDAEARDRIVKLVADIARKNEIPDGNVHHLPEPVQARQAFFVVDPSQNKRAPAPNSEETWIAVNAPVKATDELMACVNQIQAEKKAPVQMAVNGCNVESPKQASQLLAMNAARNQAIFNTNTDLKPAAPVVAAPAAAMPPPAAVGSAPKSGFLDEPKPSAVAKTEQAKQAGQPRGGAASNASGFGAERKEGAAPESGKKDVVADDESPTKKSESPKAASETKVTRDEPAPMESTDKDEQPAPPSERGAVAGRMTAARQATTMGTTDAQSGNAGASPEQATRARDGSGAKPFEWGNGPLLPMQPPAPAVDGCVTLSICVRNPVAQRGRVAPPTATQASDTLRPPAPTSTQQTSMPAAGAGRD